MRVALFGSPVFAIPTLEMLAAEHNLVLVVSQPDRPAGRGMRLASPPTKQRATELGIPVLQPTKVRGNTEFAQQLEAYDLDVIVTAAYGQILPQHVLNIPHHGVLNVHGSLLPRWRGAAPVQWALMAGDAETGITIMQTDKGMDTGPIRLVKTMPITDSTTALTLFSDLATLGAQALSEALAQLAAGTLPLEPQNNALATHARMLTPADGHIVWAETARQSYQRWQGTLAWPGVSFLYGNERVKVASMRVAAETGTGTPGTITGLTQAGLLVQCGHGVLELLRVKAPGKREMDATAWANGRGVRRGDCLG